MFTNDKKSKIKNIALDKEKYWCYFLTLEKDGLSLTLTERMDR
jgi:hypothetical protein